MTSATTAEAVAEHYGYLGRPTASRAQRSRAAVARVRALRAAAPPLPLSASERAARSRKVVARVRAQRAADQGAQDRAARACLLREGVFTL